MQRIRARTLPCFAAEREDLTPRRLVLKFARLTGVTGGSRPQWRGNEDEHGERVSHARVSVTRFSLDILIS